MALKTVYNGDKPLILQGKLVQVDVTQADAITHADIPDGIKSLALGIAGKVEEVQTPESITFIAASDAHQLDTSVDIVNGNKHAGMAKLCVKGSGANLTAALTPK